MFVGDQLEDLLKNPHDPRNVLVTGSTLAVAAVGLATGCEVPAGMEPAAALAAAAVGAVLDHARRHGNSSSEEDDMLAGVGYLQPATLSRRSLDY